MMIHRCLVVALLTIAASQTNAQVKWETSLDAALEKAEKVGRPLLISMHTSTEVACQRMLNDLYTDAEVVALLNEFILLPTCFDAHEEVEREVDGRMMSVSPLFGTVDCKTLQAAEAAVRERYFDNNQVKVPQHVFVGSDGKVYSSKVYELKKAKFMTLLRNALLQFGDTAADGMDTVTQDFLKTVKRGSMRDKRGAVKGILDMNDARKADVLYLTIESISKDNEKGECVRAFGSDQYSWAAANVVKWLRDPDEHVRHCAVVSLEEMRAPEAHTELVRLYEKERDKELKKDILRAMGPCCAGHAEVKEILLKHVKDRREDNRIAAYLSLGYFLDDPKVQETLQTAYKDEGKSIIAKTGIIWAYTYSKDEDLIPQMKALVADEKNDHLHYLADAAERMIKTGDGVAPGAALSEHIKLHNALGAILGKDKIIRNRHKYYKGDD